MNVLVFSAASWLRRPGRAAGALAMALSLAAVVLAAGMPARAPRPAHPHRRRASLPRE